MFLLEVNQFHKLILKNNSSPEKLEKKNIQYPAQNKLGGGNCTKYLIIYAMFSGSLMWNFHPNFLSLKEKIPIEALNFKPIQLLRIRKWKCSGFVRWSLKKGWYRKDDGSISTHVVCWNFSEASQKCYYIASLEIFGGETAIYLSDRSHLAQRVVTIGTPCGAGVFFCRAFDQTRMENDRKVRQRKVCR